MDRGPRRRARFERHRLALGKREHAIFAKPSRELRAPAAGPVLARRHQRHRPCVLCNERGPGERPRAGIRLGDTNALPILEARRELAIDLAAIGQREDAAHAGGRDVDRANH